MSCQELGVCNGRVPACDGCVMRGSAGRSAGGGARGGRHFFAPGVVERFVPLRRPSTLGRLAAWGVWVMVWALVSGLALGLAWGHVFGGAV